MKKKTIILIAILITAVLLTAAGYEIHASRIVGDEGLIAAARREIKNIADIDEMEITIAGRSTLDSDTHLVWFITGNEYQMNRYIPMEFTEVKDDVYEFEHKYSAVERGQDIFALMWHHSYSFIVNNPDCKSISVWGKRGETKVNVDEIPFVYHYPGLPGEYKFYDADGSELR